mmetsp:Transcript_54449/g.151698  ORF Transcript_54449/g.151698 Transcript_54449/m.151698 type:complete len:479 (+) Transcript_54449:78-1514(+)
MTLRSRSGPARFFGARRRALTVALLLAEASVLTGLLSKGVALGAFVTSGVAELMVRTRSCGKGMTRTWAAKPYVPTGLPLTPRTCAVPVLRRLPVAATPKMGGAPSLLDEAFAPGYTGVGEDWSYAKSSERPDRPLSNDDLRSLTAKSDLKGFLQLGAQYAQILVAAVLMSHTDAGAGPLSMMLRLLCTAVMGFGMVTMGHCAQHECIHNTAFRTRRINEVVSWLVSLPRLTNPVWERMLHRDHHTYTNDPARDPEIMAGSPANALPDSLSSYVTRVLRVGGGRFGLGVWSTRVAILWNCARGSIVGYSGSDPVPDKKAKFVRAELQRSCRLQIAFYAGVLSLVAATGCWAAVVKYWVLPMLIGEPCHAFYHIADHLNCEHDFRNGRGNTRTTTAPAFVSFNLWNMNYHAEHHLYPSIPFHSLPSAHKLLQGHFERTSPSALSMHRQLLGRWMPHFRSRLQQGRQSVEADWVPCFPDH